jgi:hypothetical protein
MSINRIVRCAAPPFVWISQNAALLTAISSMLIAAASLYYTIDAQRTDREYKEVAIQPRLWLGGDWEDLSLTFMNTGLGPAIIDSIVLKVGDKCKSTDDFEPDEWAEVFTTFATENIDGLFAKTLPPMPWVKGGKRKYDTQTDILRVGDTVRPGDKTFIIRLDPGTLKELVQIDSTELLGAKQKFATAAFSIPIRIAACSATGRTCAVIGRAAGCLGFGAEDEKRS